MEQNISPFYKFKRHHPDLIHKYRAAVEANPNDANSHVLLGISLVHAQEEDAKKEFNLALQIEPTNAIVHLCLGAIAANEGRIDDALIEFRETVRLDANSSLAHFWLGMLFEQRQQKSEAFLSWKQVLLLEGDQGNLAWVAKAHELLSNE